MGMLQRPEHLILLAAVVVAAAGYLLWVRHRDRSEKGDQ